MAFWGFTQYLSLLTIKQMKKTILFFALLFAISIYAHGQTSHQKTFEKLKKYVITHKEKSLSPDSGCSVTFKGELLYVKSSYDETIRYHRKYNGNTYSIIFSNSGFSTIIVPVGGSGTEQHIAQMKKYLSWIN